MFKLFNKFLQFHNIQEITFTRVKDDIFTMKVESDVLMNDKALENCIVEAELCVIDPILNMNMRNEEYTYNDGVFCTKSQTFEIPLNIRLLMNKELKEYFTITHLNHNT